MLLLYCQLTEQALLKKGLKASRSIAEKSNANFIYAARILPRPRRDFFYTSYAVMRIIDDIIDEEFLQLTVAERNRRRPDFSKNLDLWLEQVIGRDTSPGPIDTEILAAFRHIIGQSDLTNQVWRDLSKALRMDVSEIEMETWDQFLRYCDGATVAPASIYIYLSAATYDDDEIFRYKLPNTVKYYAQDLAIFCYIVHIIRDLAKDSERSPRLVTIPNEILFEAGLTRHAIHGAIATKSTNVLALTERLLYEAERHRVVGYKMLGELESFLGRNELTALKALITVYDKLYKAAADDAFKVARHGPELELLFRTKIK